MDIDFFLLRLNRNIPEVAAKWIAFVLPVISFLSLMFTILIIILFRRQKDYIGVQKLVSCITVMTTLSLVVRIPLSIKLLGDNEIYTDYLEFKWCEIFARVNVDTPSVINIITGLLKVGLAVQGLIMMFAPKKVEVLMTSCKTVWFCFFTCLTGICVYIPAMYLLRFVKVDWFSRLDETVERECCIPFPSDMVMNVVFYQRNVYLGMFLVTHVFPIVTMVTVGILLKVRLYILKRVSQSDAVATYQQKEIIRAISMCMFTFSGLALVGCTSNLIITLTYAQVDIGIPFDEVNFLVSYLNMGDTFCLCMLPPTVLAVFCYCDTRFKVTFMHFIGRRRN